MLQNHTHTCTSKYPMHADLLQSKSIGYISYIYTCCTFLLQSKDVEIFRTSHDTILDKIIIEHVVAF